MHKQILATLLAAAMGLTSGSLHAQQPTPPNLDAIPEKMPFSTPYGAPIGAQRAQELIQAATAEATKKGWAMNISVVDSGANPYDSPHIHSTPKVSANTGSSASIAANRSISGSSRVSGMLGIRS